LSRKPSPDESLISDGGRVPPDAGLVYPFGDTTPAPGELITVAPGVRWVRMTMPNPDHINLWVVDDRDEQGDGVALIDAGLGVPDCRETWHKLLKGPLAGVRVTRIIVTHFHPDHVGAAGWLCEDLGVRLWMTRDEWMFAAMQCADVGRSPPPGIVALWRSNGWSQEQLDDAIKVGWGLMGRVISPIPPSYVRIVEGDVLDFAGERWRVMIGRGHCPEHACLLNERTGVLIAGDQVLPTISALVAVQVNEPFSNPMGEWLDSIDRFSGLPQDILVLPSHGLPFVGIGTRLAAIRKRYHARLTKLYHFLSEPRRVVDCFPLLFRREVKGMALFSASGEVLAHLRWLEVAGRAKRHVDDDGIIWFSAVH
jgi:glyoxylase-like metal-dependent hydrolase (beta-lactamase superfamily II)